MIQITRPNDRSGDKNCAPGAAGHVERLSLDVSNSVRRRSEPFKSGLQASGNRSVSKGCELSHACNGRLGLHLPAHPPREVGEELPRHPPRPRPPRGLPLDRLGPQPILFDLHTHERRNSPGSSPDIRPDVHGWNPSHRPNRSDSDTFSSTASDGLIAVDRLILDHVARHQVAAVRGGIEHHILRPPLDPAVQHGLQRLVMLVIMAERQVIAEQENRAGARPQHAPADARPRADPRGSTPRSSGSCPCRRTSAWTALTRLDFPIPRAPQRSALLAGSPVANCRVLASRMSRDPVDPDQQPDPHPRHMRHRLQPVRPGVPDKGLGRAEIRGGRRGRADPLQRLGDAGQGGITRHAFACSSSSSSGSTQRPCARRSASRFFSIRRIRKIDTS